MAGARRQLRALQVARAEVGGLPVGRTVSLAPVGAAGRVGRGVPRPALALLAGRTEAAAEVERRQVVSEAAVKSAEAELRRAEEAALPVFDAFDDE